MGPPMSKSAADATVVAEKDCSSAIIAVFPTVNGNFRYFVEEDRHNALQSLNAEKLEETVSYPPNLM